MNTMSHADYVLMWIGQGIAWGAVALMVNLIVQHKHRARKGPQKRRH